LPGILVGGKVPGTFSEFEDAIEHDELAIFLRLNEEYDPSVEEDRPLLEEKVIGVPGVSPNPSPYKPKAKLSVGSPGSTPTKAVGPPVAIPPTPATPAAPRVPPPTPVNRRNDFDVSDELTGYGLQVCYFLLAVHLI
jgi:SH3 domain-binding glutamic acid-rich protein